MKLLVLILAMATNAIAFEQIFAVNCGGNNHKDQDNITYQEFGQIERRWGDTLQVGSVPESDADIYRTIDRSNVSDSPIKFDIPLEKNGFYVLIAKFSYNWFTETEFFDMTLNDDINLLTNVDLSNLCGGNGKICDAYFYFCVSDQKVYYSDKKISLIKNEKIHVKVRPVEGFANIAGLVVLKGSLGENVTLMSSASREPVNFELANTHPICTAEKPDEFQTTLVEIRTAIIALQNNIETNIDNSLINITNTCAAAAKSSIEGVKKQFTKESNEIQVRVNRLQRENLKK
jgi:Malectin domain